MIPRCDACGDFIAEGEEHWTDATVCGGSDGPGFYLHGLCCEVTTELPARGRVAVYTAQREENERLDRHIYRALASELIVDRGAYS